MGSYQGFIKEVKHIGIKIFKGVLYQEYEAISFINFRGYMFSEIQFVVYNDTEIFFFFYLREAMETIIVGDAVGLYDDV